MTNRSRVVLFVLLFLAAGFASCSHHPSGGEKWPPGWTTQRLNAAQVEHQKQWVYKLFPDYSKLEGQDAVTYEDFLLSQTLGNTLKAIRTIGITASCPTAELRIGN